MVKSANLVGVLKKPTEKFQAKGRNGRHVTYKEPRLWRSEASHQRFLSNPPDGGASLRGTCPWFSSSDSRQQDLARIISDLETNKKSNETCLLGLHKKLDVIERQLAVHFTQSLFNEKLRHGMLIKNLVSQWCVKIDKSGTWFMGRYMPIDEREMKIFANAKAIAESFLCHWYEPYHPQYWKHSKQVRLEEDPPYDHLKPVV